MKCIWCDRDNTPQSEEHIIPDCLGCPPGAIFRNGEVCDDCNHGMSHLDSAICSAFELPKFHAGVLAKGGRSPRIATRGNMVGLYKPDGQPHIDINMDRETITTPDGRRVAGFKGSKANVRAKFTDLGEGNVKINIEYDLNLNRIFVRGLYKIGFEFLALVHGAARCYDSKFDQIRGFVRHDLGERLAVAVAVPETEYSIELFHCEPDHPAPERTALRVGALVFMMDLTQGSTLIKEFAEEAQRRNPEWWKLIPE